MTRSITRDGTPRAHLRRLARTVVTEFGSSTARLRLPPAFIIAGAQRCATTSVFRMLSEHPQVHAPLLNKGIHYFDTAEHYAKGSSFYLGHFRLRRPWRSDAVTGEASPYYVFHPLAISRIANDIPGAQVVVLLRDPVERAFSAYKQEFRRGFETLPSFEEALGAEKERLDGEEARLEADPTYHSFAHQHFGYVARGRYTRQLERAVKHLGRDRLTVIDLGALESGDLGIWDSLLSDIGLTPWRPSTMIHANAAPSNDMAPETRELLTETFAQENSDLTKFLGYTPSWCT